MDSQLHRMSSRMQSMREDLLSARFATELDPMTRIYNRGAFDDALKRYVDLASLSSQPLAVMMIDLDHFKIINDVHGHQCGDDTPESLLARADAALYRAKAAGRNRVEQG